jgi:4-amino-4-deoxy-L-arabinose transferase-like glycosyltransferase
MIKDSVMTAAVPLAGSGRTWRAFKGRGVAFVAAGAGILMLVLNTLHRESYSGDEGFYGVTALNMLQAPEYIIRPSYYPAGDFLADKDGFAHPPFNSYLYALSFWLSRGSLIGPDVVNVLSFVLLLFISYRLIALYDLQAARFATLLLAASPAILTYYSQLEPEPLMTSFGLVALYCVLRGGMAPMPTPWAWLFLGGVCLGLSYALKLWLCGPLVLAVGVALCLRARHWQGKLHHKLGGILVFAAAALLPSAAHLLAVWWVHPNDIGFWVKNIYFGVFTNSGISGSKLGGGGTPAEWVHPVWYYGAALYRDHFFLLPIIVLGLRSALRDAAGKSELLWAIGAGLFGLAPLSLMKVKEPLYVLSCSIFIYFLAGLCLAALIRRIASETKIDSLSARLGTAVLLGLLLLFPLAYARGIQPEKITRMFVIAHSITFILFLGLFLWSRRKGTARLFERSVYAACVLSILAVFAYTSVTHRPRDQMITRLVMPYLQDNSPNTVSMIASNFKCYQLYSYRRGTYWHDLPLEEGPEIVLGKRGFANVGAFILDPDDLQKATIAPWLRWLETHAAEKTGELDRRLGHASGFRVFVRR